MSIDQLLAERLQGKFIVLDGPDGAGKSTQHRRLEVELTKLGIDTLSCRDPGGTAIGNRIRSVLLDHDLTEMDVNCETLLFMASRAQLLAEIVKPALREKKTVLCDRFVTSTCAYQGAAGYDPRRVIELARFAIGECWPTVTIVIDVDVERGFERIGRTPSHAGKNRKLADQGPTLFTGSTPDAMEARPLSFHRRVREVFQTVGDYYPTPVVVIDGDGDAETIYARIIEGLHRVTF